MQAINSFIPINEEEIMANTICNRFFFPGYFINSSIYKTIEFIIDDAKTKFDNISIILDVLLWDIEKATDLVATIIDNCEEQGLIAKLDENNILHIKFDKGWKKIPEQNVRIVLACTDLPEDCTGSVNGRPFEMFAYPHTHNLGFENCPKCGSSMEYKEMMVKKGN